MNLAQDFSNVELTMEEEHECLSKAITDIRYKLYKKFCAEMIMDGIPDEEIKEKAIARVNEEEVDVSEEELEAYLKEAKESKFYKLKTTDYFEKLKKPKEYDKPNPEEFLKMVDQRIRENFEGEMQALETYQLLQWYFTQDKKFEEAGYNLKKGILLAGGIGCGKTTMMKAFSKNIYQSYTVASSRAIADVYQKDGIAGVYKYYDTLKVQIPTFFYGQTELGWLLDDIGVETSKKHYGDDKNIISELFMSWYDKKEKNNVFNKIHGTTNLTTEELQRAYGLRATSRMREMLNIIVVKGKDLRK